MKASEIKKMLAPVLDFEKHSVTQLYSESLPPETQEAIKEKRVLVGMDHEQVRMALGQPAAQVARDEGRPGRGGLGLRHAARQDHVRDLQRR